ncbi:MAG TPA: non-ribosomal peptide synthetase [Candidatus Polarisedimenticolia bacterium]|nr:non-ribosomal peptide synthetase [Candidatus Polarisedimenticolia bacterium]
MMRKDAMRRPTLVRTSSPLDEHSGAPGRVSQFPPPVGEPRPRDGLLHRIFEGQADARPRSMAVLWDERVTAYCILEARANRLARHLRCRGVGAGSLVAMLLPQSPEAYVALLGILKAGGAFIPLDPDWDGDLTASLLRDSGATALVTSDELAAPYANLPVEIVRLDADREAILAQSPMRLTRVEVGLKAEDLCCVIYDPASTGRPRGVMIEHRNAAHLARAERWLYSMRPDDRVYQGASLSSDRSLEEIWLAFSAGAALVPATAEMARSGPDLPQLLARRGVTVLSSVPTFLSLMEGSVPSLRLLILGGEPCPPPLVKRWARPGLRILNTYGPAEATVVSTCGEMRAGRPVNLGTAIPGTRVYLMDERQRPVARSEAGEICIAGGGVARGYLGDPEETRRRFVRDPFAPRDERPARLFRTGVRARLDWDGNFQLVSPGEGLPGMPDFAGDPVAIESAFLEMREVRAAALGVREDAAGSPQPAAYVVMRRGAQLDLAALLDHLRRRLPPERVPPTVEVVSALPLLSTGGLDRAALARPLVSRLTAAGSETQRRILSLWEDLFRPCTVSPEDHFFLDLGGTSLMAARLAHELRKVPHLAQASTADVYRYPTVASLARELEARLVEAPRRAVRKTRRRPLWRRILRRAWRALGLEAARHVPHPLKFNELREQSSEREETYDERGQGSFA